MPTPCRRGLDEHCDSGARRIYPVPWLPHLVPDGRETQPGRLPLLALHGGPGAPHDYLESLEAIADTGRQVVFYDQFGCGNSDQPHDPSLWTVELFVAEVGAVRSALGLDHTHLLGQSWGGMLACEHAVLRPKGLRRLVVANSPASMVTWVSEANRLRADLPAETQAALSRHEADGTTDHPDYAAATRAFYDRHLCRVPWPPEVERTFEAMASDPTVYGTMNGPSEFHVVGSLKSWTIEDRLHRIAVPVLLLSGAYDEATPLTQQPFLAAIPDIRQVVFPQSSHLPHVEERAAYMRVVDGFLA